MNNNIAEETLSAGRQAAAYWFVDGLPEILAGILFALGGAVGFWGGLYMPHSISHLLAMTVSTGIVLLLVIYDRKILEWVKLRLTYLRTGYVRPPVSSEKQRLPTSIALNLNHEERRLLKGNVIHFHSRTVLVIYLGGYLCGLIQQSWGISVAMLGIASGLFLWNRRSVHPYAWWEVLFLSLVGLLCMRVDAPGELFRWLVLLISGLWLFSRGVWTLAGYLKANPKIAPARGELS